MTFTLLWCRHTAPQMLLALSWGPRGIKFVRGCWLKVCSSYSGASLRLTNASSFGSVIIFIVQTTERKILWLVRTQHMVLSRWLSPIQALTIQRTMFMTRSVGDFFRYVVVLPNNAGELFFSATTYPNLVTKKPSAVIPATRDSTVIRLTPTL